MGTIERAYAIARSGSCRTVDDIRRQLKRERFEAVDAHLVGARIASELRALCARHYRAEPTEGSAAE